MLQERLIDWQLSLAEQKELYYSQVDRVFKQIENDAEFSAFTLSGTGFLVREQIYAFANAAAHINANGTDFFDSDYKKETEKAWIEDAFLRTSQDIRSFYQEFVEYSPALPIPAEVRVWGEPPKSRLFARYGNSLVLYEDIVDEFEREGAALAAMRLVEKTLVSTKPGDKVIFVSPAGWTGMADPEEHKDAHVYVFGHDESLTLRTRMDHAQSVAFLNQLAGRHLLDIDSNSSEKERIKSIMGKVVVVNGYEFEDVAHEIRTVIGSDVVWEDDNGARTYGEMIASIKNRSRAINLGEEIEVFIDDLKDYVENEDPKNFSDEFIAGLIYRIGRIVLEIELNQNPEIAQASSLPLTEKYKNAHILLQARSGCSHAPNKRKNTSEVKILCCTCPFCGRQVEAIIKDGMIICPICHMSRSWQG